MKAEKLPSGAWRYRIYYYVGGERRSKSFTDIDRETARRAAVAFSRDHERHPVSSGSVGSMVEAYIAARSPHLSPATVVGYKNISRRLKAEHPFFYGAAAHTLRRADFQELINSLAASGASPKTIRNIAGLLSSSLSEQGIHMGPLALPKKTARNITVPTEEEVRALLAATAGTRMEIPVMLGAFGGLRRGEVCALRLDDVDFEAGVVHVCRDVVMGPNRRYIEKPPKTVASDRFIELPPEVIDRIRAAGIIYDENPRMLSYRFRRLCEDVFSGVRFRFHDLRHFCVSYLHALGVPDSYIQQRCGFQNDAVLRAVYRHTMADQDRRFIALANSSFSGMLKSE